MRKWRMWLPGRKAMIQYNVNPCSSQDFGSGAYQEFAFHLLVMGHDDDVQYYSQHEHIERLMKANMLICIIH
jgi:hypothetical protein